jgi:hypothetical protein
MICRLNLRWGFPLLLVLWTGSVHADPFRVSVQKGTGWTQGEHSGGLTLEGSALGHWKELRLGVTGQFATGLLNNELGFAAVAGLGLGDPLQVTVLGEAGMHHYSGVGAGFMSEDPGADGSLPYAGGRLLVGYRVTHSRRVNFALAGSFALNHDLHTLTRHYSYTETGWLFSDESYPVEETVTLGQTQSTLTLGAIVTWSL